MGLSLIVAGHVRKIGGRPVVGRLPMDCPYCGEMLQDVRRGWVCRRCACTVGAESGMSLLEEGQQ